MTFKDRIKATFLGSAFIWVKGRFTKLSTQNEETEILDALLARYPVPKTFIEFGFSGWEFNCASLVDSWEGLLVDGAEYNVRIGRITYPKKIQVKRMWITLDTIAEIAEFAKERELGILSVDVDGNDYWFLQSLIKLKPAIIIIEYNSTLQLWPLTVPYDPTFDRREKHPSRLYYGLSLAAADHLARRHGYSLMVVGESGINSFFVRNDLLGDEDAPLDLAAAFREKQFPDGARAGELWKKIEDMPYVDVTTLADDEVVAADAVQSAPTPVP